MKDKHLWWNWESCRREIPADPERVKSNGKIPRGLNLMCSDNEEIHLHVKLQEIQGIKKGGIHGFYELGVTVASSCCDTLDNI